MSGRRFSRIVVFFTGVRYNENRCRVQALAQVCAGRSIRRREDENYLYPPQRRFRGDRTCSAAV